MQLISALGLLFALVFGLVLFLPIIDVQEDIVALTSGGLQSIAALFPVFWMLLLGIVGIAAVVAAVKLWG